VRRFPVTTVIFQDLVSFVSTAFASAVSESLSLTECGIDRRHLGLVLFPYHSRRSPSSNISITKERPVAASSSVPRA